MTKEEFKRRWDSDENGGGLTFEDIADCAKEWGIHSRPKIANMGYIRYLVLQAAKTNDAEEFKVSHNGETLV